VRAREPLGLIGHRAGLLARLAADELRRAADRVRRMCEYGTIVCADESAKLPGTICAAAPAPANFAPGLHVPRMPSVSHVPV
jgi:hypothetical protein